MTRYEEVYGSYRLVESDALHLIYKHRKLPDLALVFTDTMQGYDQDLILDLPGKGKVTNEVSVFWHGKFNKWGRSLGLKTAFLGTDEHSRQKRLVNPADASRKHIIARIAAPELMGRTTILTDLAMLPFKFVIYGYLCGELYVRYQAGERRFGETRLPDGLNLNERLPEPVAMLVAKDDKGSYTKYVLMESAISQISKTTYGQRIGIFTTLVMVKNALCTLYKRARYYSTQRGLIIAEARFSVGASSRSIVLLSGDILTPDSARYWASTDGGQGRDFILHNIQDYLLKHGAGENITNLGGASPQLPDCLLEEALQRYQWLCDSLKGSPRAGFSELE